MHLNYTVITYGVAIDLLQSNLRKALRTSISKFVRSEEANFIN